MTQTNSSRDEERGKRNSNIVPKLFDYLPREKKPLYMDEAIAKTKFGLFNYVIIFISGLVIYAAVLETISFAYALPVSECDLNLSTSQKGILGAATFVGFTCSSHLWGFLADTRGRRRVILPSLLAAMATTIVCSFVKNFYVFTALRFLNGFFMSCSTGTIYAYLGEFHDNAHRSRAIMGAATIHGLVSPMSPLSAWAVINHDWRFYIPFLDLTYKPWRLYMIVCTIPTLLCAIAIWTIPH